MSAIKTVFAHDIQLEANTNIPVLSVVCCCFFMQNTLLSRDLLLSEMRGSFPLRLLAPEALSPGLVNLCQGLPKKKTDLTTLLKFIHLAVF